MNLAHSRRHVVVAVRYLYELVDRWSVGITCAGFCTAGLVVLPKGAPEWIKAASDIATLTAFGLLLLGLVLKKKKLTAIYQHALRTTSGYLAQYARRRLDAYLETSASFDVDAATGFSTAEKTAFNQELFAGSGWDTDVERRLSRNQAVLAKNPYCIAMERNAQGEPELFSYAIPLSPFGEAIYMSGALADLDFDSSHVSGPDDTYDTILIFAVGRAGGRNVGRGLTDFATEHFSWLAARSRRNGEVRPIRLIAQTEMGGLARLMTELGFGMLHQTSRDGHRLMRYYLT